MASVIVGAGDNYTAALALGLLSSHEPENTLENVCLLTDGVYTQPEAMSSAPAHHCAVGVGHIAAKIDKLG